MKLKHSVITEIQNNKILLRELEDLFDKSYFSIHRWLKENNENLIRYDSLLIISLNLNIPIDNLIVIEQENLSS